MRFDVLTIFTGFFDSPLKQSIIGKGIERGVLQASVHDIRKFSTDKHHTTDDAPYGGGVGMVMKPEPLIGCIEAVKNDGNGKPWIVLTSARGASFTHDKAACYAGKKRIMIVCGRYEGVDERVREFVDEEVSIGDYVLTGGEPAALVIMDAVARLVPGVLGKEESAADESYAGGLLEYPHYTRPEDFQGMKVPEVLLSGNHAAIAKWRRRESLRITFLRRPDLLDKAGLSDEDVAFLTDLGYKRRA